MQATPQAEESTSFYQRIKDVPVIGEFLPILMLLIVVGFVLARLPRVNLGEHVHTDAFRRRRVSNWLPLGLTYAFLYMGRYNLTVSKGAFEEMVSGSGGVLMGNDTFGWIFGIGTYVYGFSFLLNGPLTDRFGGRFSILLGAAGAAVANALMGFGAWSLMNEGPGHEYIAANFLTVYATLYALNMYFQSFGAVAIVKVNAPWFHVRERGVFGAIFGILISLGVYFAFDIGGMILDAESLGLTWVFWMPAILLALFWVIDFFHVKDTPGGAGLIDFNTADASSGDGDERKTSLEVFKLMLRNPIILTIAGIEFCSGFLRQAIMQWYRTFAKQTDGELGLKGDFVYDNWGMLLCCAGILGGVFAGTISDHFFQSRRGPVAAVLYGIMLLGAGFLVFGYQQWYVGWVVLFMSMAVIGVHGMLSGTASMDFGGSKNVGIAVGIIDGFVYLGTAIMSVTYALLLPEQMLEDGKMVGPATDPDNWIAWPVAMVPLALLGLILATRVWSAKPTSKPAKAG
ncbi:MAG: MFS transporter [Planctomycetota bacterium]|nr:MFS transporter [Planctomycetota bacterium]